MSKLITIEIDEEVYLELEKSANLTGRTPEEIVVERLLNNSKSIAEKESAMDAALLASGLVTSLPSGLDRQAFQAFQPIQVVGKPVSETIIEERR